MGHRQKGKHRKRSKSWHRGRVESKAWERVAPMFQDKATCPDPSCLLTAGHRSPHTPQG